MTQIEQQDLVDLFSSILNSGILSPDEVDSIKIIDSFYKVADEIDAQWGTNLFVEVSKAKYEIHNLIGERIVKVITGEHKCL